MKSETLNNIVSNKYLAIIMAALLIGFGWHIRGDGTSDVTVVALLLVLFIGATFPNRNKFNFVVFAIIVAAFLFLRTGWGTFVAQAGIPGIYDGHIQSKSGEYDIIVSWWQGYFWLFIVGIAWAGIPSLILGGYFFTKKKYTIVDLLIYIIIFSVSTYLGEIIAEKIVPLISSAAYNEVYIRYQSGRNYWSMIGNFSTAFALLPVLIFIWFQKKDWDFIKHTLVVTALFAFALSFADIWQAFGNNNRELHLPAWNLWEYFTGFIFAGLLFLYYYSLPANVWKNSDAENFVETKYFNKLGFLKYPVLVIIYYYLLLYGIIQSIIETVYKTSDQFNIARIETSQYVYPLVILSFIVLFALYRKGKIGLSFSKKSFQDKALISLIVLVPFYYICLITRYVLTDSFLVFEMPHLVIWIDTISVILFEVYAIISLNSRSREVETTK